MPSLVFAEMTSNSFTIRDDSFSNDGTLGSAGGAFSITSSIETIAHGPTDEGGDWGVFAGYHAVLFDEYVSFAVSPVLTGLAVDIDSFNENDNILSLANSITWLDQNFFEDDIFEFSALIERNNGDFLLVNAILNENDLSSVEISILSNNFDDYIGDGSDYERLIPLSFNLDLEDEGISYVAVNDLGTLDPGEVARIMFATMGTIENPAGFDVYISQNGPLTGGNTGEIIPGIGNGNVVAGTSAAGFRTLKTETPLNTSFDNEDTALDVNPQLVFSSRRNSHNELGVYEFKIAISEEQETDNYENEIYFTFVPLY